jgi:hypothetical protein
MKTIFFAPHAAIWIHAFPEALVAEALAQHGQEVVYLTCGRVFERHCIPMTAMGLSHAAEPRDKAVVCELCRANASVLRERLELRGMDIADVLMAQDYELAEREMSAIRRDNFLTASLGEVEYGRAALSSFLLQHKKTTLAFSDAEWPVLLTEIRHSLLSLLAARRVFEAHKPDRLVLYSPGYSVNLVWAKLAEKRGIPQYYIQGSNNLSDRLQKLIFARGLFWQGLNIEQWKRFKHMPCSPAAARYVTDHFLEIIKGRSALIYSLARSTAAPDLRARFGVGPDQKLVVATMSSYDELLAGEITGQIPRLGRGAFATQVQWISCLIEFFRGRPDLFLLIRVHPREFPNRRERVKSEHATELEARFTNLPPNVRINWPSEGVSLYDLAEEMDLCLNAWSNAGKEMSYLGIPVVLYSTETIFYPPGINYAADDEAEYLALIDRALADGWRIENAIAAFRWYALDDLYSRIDLSDSYAYKEHQKPALPLRVVHRLRRMLNPAAPQLRDVRARASRLKMGAVVARAIETGARSLLEIMHSEDLPATTPAEEAQAVRAELLRVARALYGGDLSRPGGQLRRNLLGLLDRQAPKPAGAMHG